MNEHKKDQNEQTKKKKKEKKKKSKFPTEKNTLTPKMSLQGKLTTLLVGMPISTATREKVWRSLKKLKTRATI